MTKIEVVIFKETGKMYFTDEFESEISILENNLIVEEIRKKYPSCKKMDFTFKATAPSGPNNQMLNWRLVKA